MENSSGVKESNNLCVFSFARITHPNALFRTRESRLGTRREEARDRELQRTILDAHDIPVG